MSISKLAQEFNMSRPGVKYILEKAGVNKKQTEQEKEWHTRNWQPMKEEFQRLADEGWMAHQIEEKYGIPRRKLTKIGVRFNPNNSWKRTYTLNEQTFDVINTELKAYMLGFITSDGCIQPRETGGEINTFSFELSVVDEEVLTWLAKVLGTNRPIKYSLREGKESCYFHIRSKTLCNGLQKWGVQHRKTWKNTILPNLPDEMMRHYLRGIFDGNGSTYFSIKAYISTRRKSNLHWRYSKRISLYLDMGKRFTELLQEYLINNLGLKNKGCITLKCNRPDVRFTMNSKVDISKIYDYFYTDANYFLERKRERLAHVKAGELLETPLTDLQTTT